MRTLAWGGRECKLGEEIARLGVGGGRWRGLGVGELMGCMGGGRRGVLERRLGQTRTEIGS